VDKAWIHLEVPRVEFGGAWTLPSLADLERQLGKLQRPNGAILRVDATAVTEMDTAGAWLFHRTVGRLQHDGNRVSVGGLYRAGEKLVELVGANLPATGPAATPPPPGLWRRLPREVSERLNRAPVFLRFVGESAAAALPWLARPARIRWKAVFHELGEAGPKALLIVGLLAFLLGIVIAYQGGVQLRLYGASIFIADLVGLSMLRELAPLMTAIIMAGRTGSAYTAQIGTMSVTEEIDALRAIGVSPAELLVLPRLAALTLALPLLTVYADLLGVLGGMVMAGTMLGVSPSTFLDRVQEAVSLTSFLIGIGKAPVFALIIGAVGCYQGFQVQGSAGEVGRHTTVSVVQAIFFVIVVDAGFSIVFSWLGV
jgi:phospholipid/cholesterol/gamma-HCH transport system permease protein